MVTFKKRNSSTATADITNINGLVRVPRLRLIGYMIHQKLYLLTSTSINMNATEALINGDHVKTNHSNIDFIIGAHDITGLPLGQTLKGKNATHILQTIIEFKI